MGTAERRARQRDERRAAILVAARELAEAEGWDAVTTRRLAERIEYSQPVLYSHFAGKAAIVGAVAQEGFAELAAVAGRRAAAGADARAALEGVVRAYLDLARERPAVYAAMFAADTDLIFGADEAPPVLQEAFASLRDPLAAATGDADLDQRTEVLWSALHGLADLTRSGRLPADGEEKRIALLLRATLAAPPPPP